MLALAGARVAVADPAEAAAEAAAAAMSAAGLRVFAIALDVACGACRAHRGMTPMRKLAAPLDVATAIAFLVSSAAAMITGHVLAVDGGFLAQ